MHIISVRKTCEKIKLCPAQLSLILVYYYDDILLSVMYYYDGIDKKKTKGVSVLRSEPGRIDVKVVPKSTLAEKNMSFPVAHWQENERLESNYYLGFPPFNVPSLQLGEHSFATVLLQWENVFPKLRL